EGLINGPCYNKYGSEYLFQRIKMVPVGIDGPREYIPEHLARGFKVTIWSCGLSIERLAGWGSMESYSIPPGKKMGSFILTSYAIPGIRDAKIQPDIDYDNLPDEYYGNVELTKQLQDSLIYSTKTIGPTAPPADFKPIEFLDYIISLKHEAASLGWITNKGIENSLDKKLDNAKKKLEQGNTTAAKNILNAFLKEVEAQGCKSSHDCPKGKHLTPEAYGLLKYNVEYLIDNLTNQIG
ncbi:MAG: hypothetical protein VST72_09115, partial [Nitrospirota bacterium]|nr:hypothetical protein [Nitrospirota bacterium]